MRGLVVPSLVIIWGQMLKLRADNPPSIFPGLRSPFRITFRGLSRCPWTLIDVSEMDTPHTSLPGGRGRGGDVRASLGAFLQRPVAQGRLQVSLHHRWLAHRPAVDVTLPRHFLDTLTGLPWMCSATVESLNRHFLDIS